MKSRFLFVLVLLLVLFILITRSNHTVQDALLNVVTPIKQTYKALTQSVKDRGKSYIFQKETIQKLTRENKVLRKYLLDQTHYLQQVATLYEHLPSLEKLPHHSMELVDTISYIRLNSFSEVMLTRPKKAPLEEGRLYGLMQDDVVGGTAILRGENLYGYLTSNARCRFGVFIGKNRSPGIAEGLDKDTMVVKFIPKWAKVEKGDKVETSGLDHIFFANVPVGVVKSVKIESSYKTAYIKTYNDTLHPDYFFLITDPSPYLTSEYDKDSTQFDANTPSMESTQAQPDPEAKISSIPEAIQTQDTTIDPSEFEIPTEATVTPAPKPKPPVVLHHPKPTVKPPVRKKRKRPAKKPKKKPVSKPKEKTPTATEPVSETPPKPKPKKRKSAMDFLNARLNAR